jgi:hypothetical protein
MEIVPEAECEVCGALTAEERAAPASGPSGDPDPRADLRTVL